MRLCIFKFHNLSFCKFSPLKMSDISQHYGGSILAMKGKDCVCIINDKRLGNGPIGVSKNFTKIYEITPRLFVGFTGLISDAQILFRKIRRSHNLFRLNSNRDMEPNELSKMISYILYSKRTSPYYVSVIVAGLGKNNNPYIVGMDCLGCMDESDEFITSGTAANNLSGLCEALFTPDLDEESLFVTSTQAFLNAVDRDTFSGWGAVSYVIGTKESKRREIKGRCD
ncbi:Proteasome component PUP3 [Nosema bombycis CQ1]|uniref:Proteasome component PUP3 n=1 Tax=Nosema bombycis (strain CQ1 / CVCC 102059) TaxID=578461 RepID=R0KX36_NOSB1|nr:Proteasome component PUP3 [Nosema bombycis CQ1]|eukprot:EOB15441.1 Proteasome component PUP3 [Nosema bombycis CQ1]